MVVGRIMAHNRERLFQPYYEELTVGQLLLLDDNVLSYLKLTNPWGSGDGKGAPPGKKTPNPTINDAERLNKTKLKGEVSIQQTSRERLPAHLRDYIDDVERRGGDGSIRR